jgi:hypothetical protein
MKLRFWRDIDDHPFIVSPSWPGRCAWFPHPQAMRCLEKRWRHVR